MCEDITWVAELQAVECHPFVCPQQAGLNWVIRLVDINQFEKLNWNWHINRVIQKVWWDLLVLPIQYLQDVATFFIRLILAVNQLVASLTQPHTLSMVAGKFVFLTSWHPSALWRMCAARNCIPRPHCLIVQLCFPGVKDVQRRLSKFLVTFELVTVNFHIFVSQS